MKVFFFLMDHFILTNIEDLPEINKIMYSRSDTRKQVQATQANLDG